MKRVACVVEVVLTMTSRFERGVFVPPSEGLSFIEQLHALCLSECHTPKRPYLSGVSVEYEIIMLTKPACKLWACPACAARNARRWIARIINGCNKMDTVNGWHMFTLTAHEKWRGRDRSVKNLRQGWKKLYNRMRRKFGIQHYAKVWEMHKDNTFHLHGLIDCVIPTKWLKDNARQCGMGYQVEIHAVDNAGQVAGYIAKYFLKSEFEQNEGEAFPKGLRRIEVSRSWLPLKPIAQNDFSWTVNSTREGQLQAKNFYEAYYPEFKTIDTVREL